MKKLNLIFLLITFNLTVFSVTDKERAIIGTYMVPETAKSSVVLTLNTDHSFSFENSSNQFEVTAYKGTWELKSDNVILSHEVNGRMVHETWKFQKNGQVATSLQGFTFYRLCKQEC